MENEAVPFFPDLNVNPGVAPRVKVPLVTDSVSVSPLVPALASATVIALLFAVEKVSDRFSPSDPSAGAVIAGGLSALTVSATLVEAERLSPGSATETASESDPE